MARVQDLKVNKITKERYDQLVKAGTITQDMIANQLWIFTDTQYVSAQNVKDWNAKAEVSDIPTKLSDLSNDKGFITSASIPTKISDLTDDSNFANKSEIPTKTSQLTNDSNLAYKSDIPTNISQLSNDSGFAKYTDIPLKVSQLTNDANYAKIDNIPVRTSQLTNDSGFVTSTDIVIEETDPTVPSWAKQSSKPTYTKSEVGLGNVDNKSSATIRSEITSDNITSALGFTPVNSNQLGTTIATLDSSGKVPSTQLPSYVDDVLEYANQTSFPSTGETGKIYVAKDTNKTFRWGGSSYIAISSDLTLGETSSTAFAGDKGKVAYTHSQSTHAPSNAQVNVIENISVNGTNASINNKTASITMPTKLSQLENDMGYSIDGSIPTKLSQLTNDAGFITAANIPSRLSQLTNDSGYITAASIPTVPTKTSQLTNDSGFITSSNLPTKTSQLTNDSGFITSSSIPTVPTKTSQLTNDSNFITSSGSITGNAATASKTTGTLTIQKNGSNVQTFNGSANTTANIIVPTKVSELNNDSGFITGDSVMKYYVTNMTDLGFTNYEKVSPFDFFKKCYDKYGGGTYVVRFDWADARSAYISSGNNELWINGGEMLVTMNNNPNTGTWTSCNAIFLGYDIGYSGMFTSTVSSTAGTASSNSLLLFGNTRVHTGSGAPSSSTGRNGDIYIQT